MTAATVLERGAEQLYHDNVRLASWVVSKFQLPSAATYMDREDLHQVAHMGLWKACKGFSLRHGLKFSTYATVCTRHELSKVSSHFGYKMRIDITVSLDRRATDKDGRELDWDDMFPVMQDDTQITVREFLHSLNSIDRTMLRLRMQGYNQGYICKRVKLGRSTVSKRLLELGAEYINRYMKEA